MFIAALFTIAKLWKQSRFPITNDLIKKMWYLYTMEFYSATKNEILSFKSERMEVENIILSKVSQAQKDKNCMFSPIGLLYTQNKYNNIFGHELQTKGEHAWEE
jgi:hypothetical protein